MIDSQTSPKMAVLAAPACFSLSPNRMWVSTPQVERDLGAALLPDEAGEAAREFSLVGLGKGFIEHFGNGETQDAIAKKFEPLVGFALASRRRADMGEGRRDQLAIG